MSRMESCRGISALTAWPNSIRYSRVPRSVHVFILPKRAVFLEDNITPYFKLVTLSANDYKEMLKACATAGLVGGVIYHALHLQSARKAGCDRIYTFNVKDFRAIASDDFQDKISAP